MLLIFARSLSLSLSLPTCVFYDKISIAFFNHDISVYKRVKSVHKFDKSTQQDIELKFGFFELEFSHNYL